MLDAQHVLRFVDARGEDLGKRVDELLAAQKAGGQPKEPR